MAGTTLGKRSRDQLDITDCPARSTRAKRRAVATATVENTRQAVTKAKLSVKTNLTCTSPAKIKSKLKTSKPIEIYQDEKEPDTSRHVDTERVATSSAKISVTPKHRLIVAKDLTPRTPRTPERSCTAIYNQARQLFARSSDPRALIGRTSERAELTRFVEKHVRDVTCGSLYISGPPGTGKSALVAEVLEQHQDLKIRTTTINCMSITSSSELMQKLVVELGLEEVSSPRDLQAQLNNIPALVVLDEVDRLVELDLQLLYNLFEWTLAAESKLVLIGIANALDLTDRCLPQLRSRGLKPDLLPVLPYSAAQIAQIITSKLKTLDDSAMPPFLHPTAIQFCAKKIAAQTGDLRKAFDICQRAIDLVEAETVAKDARAAFMDSPSKTPLMENVNLSSPITPRSPTKDAVPKSYTITNVPRATIAHMAKITSQVFSNGANQRLATLNLQQKAVLCSLAALERRRRALQMDRVMFSTPSKSDRSAPTTKQLYESYAGLCKKSDMLHPLSVVEFREVVSGLETNGLVTGADGKHGSFVAQITPSRKPKTGFVDFIAGGDDRRISSVLGERELRSVLNTAGGELLREIIDGDC